MPVLYNKKKYIPGVYKNPSNYDNIKIYIVVPDDLIHTTLRFMVYSGIKEKRNYTLKLRKGGNKK